MKMKCIAERDNEGIHEHWLTWRKKLTPIHPAGMPVLSDPPSIPRTNATKFQNLRCGVFAFSLFVSNSRARNTDSGPALQYYPSRGAARTFLVSVVILHLPMLREGHLSLDWKRKGTRLNSFFSGRSDWVWEADECFVCMRECLPQL